MSVYGLGWSYLCGMIHFDHVVMHSRVEAAGIGQVIYLYRLMAYFFYFFLARTGYISDIVVDISIGHIVCIGHMMPVAARAIPIVIIVAGVKILRWYKYPPAIRADIINTHGIIRS